MAQPLSRRLILAAAILAFGVVASAAMAPLRAETVAPAFGNALRFHRLRWRQDSFGITIEGTSTDSKVLGPSLRAAVVIIDTGTGKTVTCSTRIPFRKVEDWKGKPLDCDTPGVGQDGDPHHHYTFSSERTSEHGASKLLAYFRIDQDAATVSFCLLGTNYNTCSGETPIPTAR